MGASLWVGEKIKVNVISDVPSPSIATITRIMEVVIKTGEDDGRRMGKSLVLKLLNGNDSILTDANSAETCNRNILSLCQISEIHYIIYQRVDDDVDEHLSLEVDNLLWLLGILVNRQEAEKFALMWANQQKLANLHKKFRTPSRHHVSCITIRLLDGIGSGKILLAAEIRQLLLQTWIQPLVDDYPRLRRLPSFDSKEVEENIEKAILELTPETQQTGLALMSTDFREQQRPSYVQECFNENKLILRIILEILVNMGRQTIIFIITLPRTLLLFIKNFLVWLY
ncbi:hypothetical protein MKW98_027938 [Papaver atlanticum]|uniref:At3g05675-like ankyrin-like domain-containing protein n=1 Tax=Papaver atlanticum TaxID=357466 RepID=A0AAD4XAT2_9MAGN|nr:hypothetical protein MKW98_027938 [Papaver atlanticum]